MYMFYMYIEYLQLLNGNIILHQAPDAPSRIYTHVRALNAFVFTSLFYDHQTNSYKRSRHRRRRNIFHTLQPFLQRTIAACGGYTL